MKTKYLFLCIGAFLFSQVSLAQKTIRGTVYDENEIPVAFANVLLLQARDSTLITGTITTENGEFELENSASEDVVIKISLLGYKDFVS
ncbi:MAG: carboxypeptidase-like regulatory domain-containing protein [Bacteroidota bacterium]